MVSLIIHEKHFWIINTLFSFLKPTTIKKKMGGEFFLSFFYKTIKRGHQYVGKLLYMLGLLESMREMWEWTSFAIAEA